MRRVDIHLIGRCFDRFNEWRAPARLRVGVVGGLVTLACSLALLPVVSRGFWMDRAIVLVCVIVAVGAVLRTLRVPLPLLPVGACLGLLGGLCALFAPEAAFLRVIPTPAAIAALKTLLEAGRADAWASVPPAEQTPGLLLIVVAAVGLVALVVDTLAAGLDLPTLTLLPLSGLYAAPWLVGAGFPPPASLILLVITWVTLLSAHERDRIRAMIPDAASSPAHPTVIAIACCLALALGVQAWLPSPDTARRSGPQGPLALSLEPIVSLRQSVIAPTGQTVLKYRTTAKRPDYLRLAALELFDGEQWRVGQVALTGPPTPTDSGPLVQYEMSIGALAGPVIPSPAGTLRAWTDTDVGLDSSGLPTRSSGWVTDTEALLQVHSLGWTARQLEQASTQATPAPMGTALDLTSAVPAEVTSLAREVTLSATNPFEQAIALQQWFTTTGGFQYSTEISDDDADLMSFLRQRVGYCEQFAATMAVMARLVGIPARVMVGFTPGRVRGGVWTVTDAEAHAWPELWMGTAGWVRFEPTPRSEAISIPSYALDSATASRPSPSPEPRRTEVQAQDSISSDDARDETDSPGPATPDPLLTFSLLAGLLALSGLPALVRWSRRRRRRFSGPNAAQDAYREVVDTTIDLGLDAVANSERATLTALSDGLPTDARAAADRIATALERLRYGRPPTAQNTAVQNTAVQNTAVQNTAVQNSTVQNSTVQNTAVPELVTTHAPAIRGGSKSSAVAAADLPRPAAGSAETRHLGEPDLSDEVATLRSALAASASRRARVLAWLVPKSLWR